MRKKIMAGAAVGGLLLVAGCGTQADRVSQNVSQDADNFKVLRRVVVINTITDTPLFEITGKLSIQKDAEDNQLEVTVKVDDETYKKHYVGLTETVTYVLEDVNGTDVDPNRYQVSYLPEAIIPVEFKRGS